MDRVRCRRPLAPGRGRVEDVMKVENPQDIGTVAGEVYRYLFENGPSSVSRMKKELGLGAAQVDQGLGWLAREDKLTFLKDKRSLLVSLNQD